jgi:tricorn protease
MSDTLHPSSTVTASICSTASTDVGLSAVGFDMSSNEHPISRSTYIVVLNKDLPSPLSPESDEERSKDEKQKEADAAKGKDDKDKAAPVTVKIDADGIGQRILALPIPARNYVNMLAGKSGVLFLAEAPIVVRENDARA